ncbi:hypothetical protein [Nibrella saemangeumensis]|uniref:hypothetical protein n=1 Tax=Nibrella saemangeumensis TaxID=1084526 RepID=UPI0031E5E4F3
MNGKVWSNGPARMVRNLRHWFAKAPIVNEQNSRWLEPMALLLLFGILLAVIWLVLT